MASHQETSDSKKETTTAEKKNWPKKYTPIMNSSPSANKITLPQFFVEMVCWFRRKYWKEWKTVNLGPNWHKHFPRQVAQLQQQANKILSHFDPDDPYLEMALRNYTKNERLSSIGKFMKNKSSPAERRIVKGLQFELDKIRKSVDDARNSEPNRERENAEKVFSVYKRRAGKSKLSKLRELDEELEE